MPPNGLSRSTGAAEFTATEPATKRAATVAPRAGSAVQTLPDRIPDRTETIVRSGQPVPLWDNRSTLTLACVLLGLEWFFRKRCRMV